MMERIAKDTASAFRCTASLEYNLLCDMLVNEPEMTAIATGAIEKGCWSGQCCPLQAHHGR